MLTVLQISNIALIESLRVEFEEGLNLLTGETGSGKSIIVDALGVLIGGRFRNELLKSGTDRGFIEGMFEVTRSPELNSVLSSAGIDEDGEEIDTAEKDHKAATGRRTPKVELIIRREVSLAGRNKIFINNQLATQSLLRDLRPFLVDIHGQGDQQTLFSPETHLEILDAFAGNSALRTEVAEAYQRWNAVRRELESLRHDEA